MSFNEQDLYTIAVGIVKDTGLEPSFESRVIDLLRATQEKNIDLASSILKTDEETRTDISEAASLALIKAQTSIEEDIIANGSAEEIEVLNDLKEAQLKMIQSFGQ